MYVAGLECTFATQALNAQAAGAAALIIFDALAADAANIPRTLRSLGEPPSAVTIPVFSVALDVIMDFREYISSGQTVVLRMAVSKTVSFVPCSNVVATSRTGDPSKTIVVGSHMDGVAAGPGNNDNGSGAMTNLELALSLARLMARGAITLTNRVRFCWWGAEEEGLVGSHWYVDHLSDAEIDEIAVNLNYDMVGSPNYVIGVYNGSSLLDGGGAEELRTGGYGQALGSAALQTMYQSYIETVVGSPHVPVEFNGRSDYGPFLARGIACSGLETGAEGIKTEYERKLFGGWANAWYDPCYHQFCDSIDNVSPEALAVNAPTAAYAVEFLGTHPQLDAFLGGIPGWTLPVSAAVSFTVATGNGDSGASGGVSGTVKLLQRDWTSVTIEYEIRGLAPGSTHGFHVHETADFSDGCVSTGGHYNPAGASHAAPTSPSRHAGDLGNVVAGADGVARGTMTDRVLRLAGPTAVIGRSVVLHKGTDDLGRGGFSDSLTTGHAGGRLACGEIVET
eukprot:SAG22_NODE_343_length_11944_cov_15.500042_2_plen_509_part_00